MDAIRIRGGNALFGETKIQGSKNAALPVMAAALLIDDISIIENCPRISDALHMQKLLVQIGCKVSRADRTLMIDARHVLKDKMAGESVTGMRSSLMLLGAMLGRLHEVTMEYPGGCVIGKRPIDIHLNALRKMGVSIQEEEGTFTARAKELCGSVITLPFPSVGATENVILAAVKAKGVTVLQNAAREPEIVTLCSFLQKAGAVIEGAGENVIIIQGGNQLHGVQFVIPADRIVAGTYLLSVLGLGGHIFLRDAPVSQMRSVLKIAVELGAEITASKEGLSVIASPAKKPVSHIKTDVYPGFPTDLQSPLMAVLSVAPGVSMIEETIFEDRFRIAAELNKMGAKILIDGQRAVITGATKLTGCEVLSRELRGGAGLVIAGCMAEGETIIRNRHFIERGYEDICRDYQNLGVNIVTE
ncbi:MAG: UDP-N-acetylglucosamine 1-carboxyvinyltransferase [Suilimivivens sp.]